MERNGAIRRFPQGFLWGSGTSAYQVEGDASRVRKTDWDAYIQNHPERQVLLPGEIGPNWWTEDQAEADFERMAQLGLNAQRFGIEWARIMPEPRTVSHEAIGRYRRMVNKLHQLGIAPLITLNHFTLPAWFAQQGGWEESNNLPHFREYAKVLANEFGDVPHWLTINEPTMTITLSYASGAWPPGKQNPKAALQVYHNLVGANNVAYEELKKTLPDAQIGSANAIIWLMPKNPHSPADQIITRIYNHFFNLDYLKRTAQHMDFTGVNYYFGYHVKFKPGLQFSVRPPGLIERFPFAQFFKPEGVESDLGYPSTPEFFLDALYHLNKRFKKPILITENGIADKEDQYRALYMLTHLVALHEAVQRGIDVRGYYHWSTVDNQELMEGFKWRFGLLAMDAKQPERTIRLSARLYEEIARSNAIDVGTFARQYLTPEQQMNTQRIIARLEMQ